MLRRIYRRFLEIGILCSDAQLNGNGAADVAGSSTEAALVRLAMAAGLDAAAIRSRRPRRSVRGRTERRRFMQTSHRIGRNGLEYLGHDLEDILPVNISATTKAAFAEYYPALRQLWMWVATGTNNTPDKILVFHPLIGTSSVDGVHEIAREFAVTFDAARPVGTDGAVVSGADVVATAGWDAEETLPAASAAATVYE